MYRASTLTLIGMCAFGFVILIFASTFVIGFNVEYIAIVGGLSGVELILYDLFKSLKHEEKYQDELTKNIYKHAFLNKEKKKE